MNDKLLFRFNIKGQIDGEETPGRKLVRIDQDIEIRDSKALAECFKAVLSQEGANDLRSALSFAVFSTLEERGELKSSLMAYDLYSAVIKGIDKEDPERAKKDKLKKLVNSMNEYKARIKGKETVTDDDLDDLIALLSEVIKL